MKGFEPEALVIVFGADVASSLQGKPVEVDATTSQTYEKKYKESANKAVDAGAFPFDIHKNAHKDAQPDYIAKIEELNRRNNFLERERENSFLRSEREKLTAEIQRLNAKSNIHCKTTIKQALERYTEHYKTQVSERSFKDNMGFINDFISSLKEKSLLREIEGRDIQIWVESLTVGSQTKKNRKNAVSGFFSWAKVA